MTARRRINQAVIVEGRDDVNAVGKAIDALLIPTHGFGITAETWKVIEKAYREKGIIILTDPDFSGEEIRRKLTAKFPNAIQAYVSREDATEADDIGIENACPEVIERAIAKALEREAVCDTADAHNPVTMRDLEELGMTGTAGSAALRFAVCAELGIGYGNAKAVLKKLEHWKIGRDSLEEIVEKVTQEQE